MNAASDLPPYPPERVLSAPFPERVRLVCRSWAAQVFPLRRTRQWLTSGGLGTMGFGVPAAIGASLACPDRTVVCFSGDGSILMNIQELATAVQYNLNLVTVIFNNNSYGNVRRDQTERFGGRLFGSELHNPDFVKLAESFGAKGERVASPEALKPVLEAAFAEKGPVIIEVEIERGSETSPWPYVLPTR